MKTLILRNLFFLVATLLLLISVSAHARPASGPIRVLFLGHDSEHHNSAVYYPMLAKALGREAIYFDYFETLEVLDDPAFLDHFDAVLLYANYQTIEPERWANLKSFIENGGGFLPIHCASWCFQNIPEYEKIIGGRFVSHKTGIFRPAPVANTDTGLFEDIPLFEAWDETYVHQHAEPEDRAVLQMRLVGENDNITKPEPWTWIRKQGEGRIFYTASGHDERVWSLPEFQELLRRGILWTVGDKRRSTHGEFLESRVPLSYDRVGNIPNYENRPDPLPKQAPLVPQSSLNYTQVAAGFRMELFASEPDIVNPICLAWDERGRLWVAETVDYPNEVRPTGGNDTIKILEDTDGDGLCDKVTVFADGLNIPTSLTFWDGGVIVAQAPDFLFLKDENGDDKADIRTTLFTGWGTRDTHAGPSNLRFGLDNWIHGTVGYSAFSGEIGGEKKQFGMGHFRFRPDGSEIEFLHQFNNNTWGLGFNRAGDAFGSTANNNPSFFGGVPETIYEGIEKGLSAMMIADTPAIAPITPNIRQVDAFGAYTAGAGHALATSDNFPALYRDRYAFVCGPTGNLLGRFELIPSGAGYISKNRFNLVASADEWFSPVAAEVGPDGNLWVADWYNFIIQHNPTPTPERGGYAAELGAGNAHVNPNRDKQHGRIYRVLWENQKAPQFNSLEPDDNDALLAALSDTNQFWRLTAQRIIVAGRKSNLAEPLRELVRKGSPGGIHALWCLSGLGLLDRDTHQYALLSKDNELKRNAIRALGTDSASRQLYFDSAVMTDPDPAVRLAAFTRLALFPEDESLKVVVNQLLREERNRKDEWLSVALKAAATRQGAGGPAQLGPNLLPNPSFETSEADSMLPTKWVVRNYKGKADHSIDKGKAKSGHNSLKIHSDEGADTSMFTKVKVEPHTDYRLSGWIRTSGVAGARGAQLNVHEIQGENSARTQGLRKRNNWTQLEVDFNTGDRSTISINCLFGGWGTSTGTAWWDDVSLRKLTYAPAAADADDIAEGNAENGARIFREHLVAACIRCHKVNGEGEGVIGPPLDGIASRKPKDYIYKSLIDPTAEIAEGFQAEVSPMPPMGVILKPQELADVMAYLMTLK